MCNYDVMDVRRFKLSNYINADESFHFARKRLDRKAPAYLHDHDYYEVFLVERGRTRHFLRHTVETLEPGALVFMRPDDAHAFQALGDGNCVISNVMFRADTADHLGQRYGAEFAGRFFWHASDAPDRHTLVGPRVERAINSMLELQSAHRSLSRIEEFLLNLITRVVDYTALLPATAPKWLGEACLASRSPEVFREGAAGFVAVAGRGHEHVCREMQRHLGVSPTAFVNRLRMEHAAMLLGASGSPVEDIARACGIENLSHFYRLFRQHYGNTPRKYRIQHNTDPLQP